MKNPIVFKRREEIKIVNGYHIYQYGLGVEKVNGFVKMLFPLVVVSSLGTLLMTFNLMY